MTTKRTRPKPEPTPERDTAPSYEEVVAALRGQLAEAQMQLTMANIRLFKQSQLIAELTEGKNDS